MVPGTRFGAYEIGVPLGEGGMGVVYRALDTRLGRTVALKVLPPSFAADQDRLARFTREARLLAALNHPNIGQIYGIEESSGPDAHGRAGGPMLVLEMIEGPTLADRLAQGPLPLDEALPVARQLAEALEYAHEQGVIHRDLKPANIKLRPDGVVKVLDFGLAKAFDETASASGVDPMNSPTLAVHATQHGMLLGTAAYMPPEQARGHAVDKRADIWSFGVVLYEMLAGRRLFDGATSSDILAAVIRQEIDWTALPATTPHHVRQLLRRCLERDPRKRLRDIGEARVLVEPQVSNGIAAPDSIPDATASRRSQRLRAFWPTLAAVLALFAIVAVGALVRRGPDREYTPLQFMIPALPTMPMALPVVNPVVAVSPDGHRIAFVGAGGIWIWSAATGESHRLEDTEGATAPFFSPDGREIAFYVDEELRRVLVDGGPVTTIVRAPAVGAATWGAGDLIVYNRWLGSETGVWSVPARGGAPHLVDRPRAPSDLHAYPALLPDGRHYLYLQSPYRRPVGERHICVASLDNGKPECFAPGDSNPVYAGTGHVLFVRRGALVALPFDADRRRVTGEAITVARGARWFGPTGAGAFAVSSNGRVLAHASPPRLSRLVWVDRTGRRVGDVGEPERYASLELSPDGRCAAVSIWNSETGGRDVWLIDLASGVLTRLTFDPSDALAGAWSPDGRTLAYSSAASGPPDIAVITLDGGRAPETLLTGPGVQLPWDWSPDGREIAYVDLLAERRNMRQVWLLSRDGQRRQFRQTPSDTLAPRFSPDGRLIAYVSNEAGQPDVYVASADGAGPARRISRAGGLQPQWRRDGRELFFVQRDGMLVAVDPSAEPPVPRLLFRLREGLSVDPGDYSLDYDVTSDGQRFLVRTEDLSAGEGLRVAIDWAPHR